MKSHLSFEDFCKTMMGEWTNIGYTMEHLRNGYGRNDLKFNPPMAEDEERQGLYRCNVSHYSTIAEYSDAMATASKK